MPLLYTLLFISQENDLIILQENDSAELELLVYICVLVRLRNDIIVDWVMSQMRSGL